MSSEDMISEFPSFNIYKPSSMFSNLNKTIAL